MRRLLSIAGLAGLAAAGAAGFRRLRGGGQAPDMTPAPERTTPADAPAPPAEASRGLQHVDAPAPADAPGPSVPSPVQPVDQDDPLPLDSEMLAENTKDPMEALVEQEEAAAAAEAGAIGGPAPDDGHGDPAMDPVYQAGGGEAEGFEAAQDALIENATHGDGRARPLDDAFNPERESDLSGAAYGEADEEKVHEVTRDSDATGEEAEASEGPGITHER